jgi:hypothetical protein
VVGLIRNFARRFEIRCNSSKELVLLLLKLPLERWSVLAAGHIEKGW